MTDRRHKSETAAREPWETPQVLTEEVRETASPYASVHRPDGSEPGLYYNES
jgi:hypothetical protein